MLLTVLPPPLIADILVIPDLEEVQEEDFVLQVAAPPRCVHVGVKLKGGREHVNEYTPNAFCSGAAPSADQMFLVTGPSQSPILVDIFFPSGSYLAA